MRMEISCQLFLKATTLEIKIDFKLISIHQFYSRNFLRSCIDENRTYNVRCMHLPENTQKSMCSFLKGKQTVRF